MCPLHTDIVCFEKVVFGRVDRCVDGLGFTLDRQWQTL